MRDDPRTATTEPPCSPSATVRGPSRRALLLCTFVAVALALPSLRTGYFLDDYHQVGLIEGWHDFDQPALNLYDSFLDFPSTPWWNWEESRTGFWRPLSSAMMWVDHALFGRSATAWHIHTLLWLAAFMILAGRLYGWLPRPVAGFALLFLAIEEAHAMTAGALCNRHALLTAVPALAGLWFYLRWRRDGWAPGRWLSPLAFVLAFFFGETTIPVLAYVLAWELTASDEPPMARVRAIAPVALLTLGYVVLYALFDLGPRATNVYINPLESPLTYIKFLLLRVPALVSGAFLSLPASLWMKGPAIQKILVTTGCLAIVGLAVLLWRLWPSFGEDERRSLRFWLLGAAGSLPPLAAAPPSDRQLLVPALGVAVVIAILVVHFWQYFRLGEGGAWARRVAATVAVILVALHVVSAGFGRIQIQLGSAKLTHRLDTVVENLAEVVAASPADPDRPIRLIVAHSPDFFLTTYPPVMWDYYHGAGSLEWNLLSMASSEQELVRTDDRSLELAAIGGYLLAGWRERVMLPNPATSQEGAVIDRQGVRVEILEVVGPPEPAADETKQKQAKPADAPLPKRVRFTFEDSLDDPNWLLVTWEEGRFVSVPMPKLGERIEIVPQPGLAAVL